MSDPRHFITAQNTYETCTVEGQGALLQARSTQTKIYCACREPGPELYAASVSDRFIVKRMPGTGHKHAPGCPSYAPPEELSGLGHVFGEAIREDAETGETLLRLDFALSKSGTRAAPPESAPGTKTEVAADPRKLRLTSLLHFLWQEADLIKWVPGMAGKRNWNVVRHCLLQAAAGKIAKSRPLADVLFVPEPWRKDTNAEIAARRVARFAALGMAAKGTRARPLGLLVGEYKSHGPARFGSKLTIKHMPGAPFFMEEALARRFEDVFGPQLMLADMVLGARVMVIATFSVADKGYASIVELGVMLVNADWIPFEDVRDHALVDRLISERRAFSKSLRFNLAHGAPIASAVLTDLHKPVSLFVAPSNADAAAIAELHLTASEGVYPAWLWCDEPSMPALPTAAKPDERNSQ